MLEKSIGQHSLGFCLRTSGQNDDVVSMTHLALMPEKLLLHARLYRLLNIPLYYITDNNIFKYIWNFIRFSEVVLT